MITYPREGQQRILVGSATPSLRVTLRDQDGEPASDVAGDVTVTVTGSDGTVLGTDIAATPLADDAGPLTGGADGAFTAEVPGAAVRLDVLEAVWSIDGTARTTTWHRVVGAFMFSIAELRKRKGIGSAASYPDTDLFIARDVVTDVFEYHTGASWVPTFDLEESAGYNRNRHLLQWRPVRALRSLSVNGTAQDLAGIHLDRQAGLITGSTEFVGRVVAGYEHGYSEPFADVRRAALTAAAFLLTDESGAASARVRSMTTDAGGTMQFSYAGEGHPTGLDEVDAVIVAHDHRLPGGW